jgi:hypothetical protein
MTQGPIYRQSRDPRDKQFQRQRLQSWAAHHTGHPLRHGLVVLLRQATLLLSVGVAIYALWAKHIIG